LDAARGDTGAEARVARAILNGADSVAASGDALVLGWRFPVGGRAEGWRMRWPAGAVQYHHDEERAYRPGGAAHVRIRAEDGWLSLNLRRSGKAEADWSVMFSEEELGAALLGLWMVWIGAGVLAAGRHRLQIARTRRRVALGRCVHCGYELTGLGSAGCGGGGHGEA
jgi:hypothetical protein